MNNSNPGAELNAMRPMRFSLWLIGVYSILLIGCAPGAEEQKQPFAVDILPPVLQAVEVLDERRIRFEFDEPVKWMDEEVETMPSLAVESFETTGKGITVQFAQDQQIGVLYSMRAGVSDDAGNTLSFLYRFSGWNPRVPEMLINEFNPRGSGKTPDCVELYAVTGGNIGGLQLIIGTENRAKAEFLFPALEITAGDFLIMHIKSTGTAEEVDEVEALDASGGLLAHETARDFWMPEGSPGLPGNNGAIALHAYRGGPIVDAVLWSDRQDDPGDERLGWTADGYYYAVDLAEVWQNNDGGFPGPSSAIDVSKSTATRSLCRSSASFDSDSAADWHTVPTRGHSFGAANSDEVYSP